MAAERVRGFILGDPRWGGICTFDGATRAEQHPEHGALQTLVYEAYEEMARREMHRLAEEAKRRFGAGRVALVHRLGDVPPGEVSVHIAAACGHRAEAFSACRFLIDELKRDVPIWKKNVYADGACAWAAAEQKDRP
ncbi:MAG: molybdenum cofactor biosynthesis protein MoaE [Planctomycetota bacterium]|nr:MAG: molybdenum cofactor biosynthesis protein MoaE [Planctomycetota bacterium]